MFLLRSSQKLCSVLWWRSGLGRNHRNHRNHVFGGDFLHFLHFLNRMAERVCLMFSVSMAAATRKLPCEQPAEEMHEKQQEISTSTTPVPASDNLQICKKIQFLQNLRQI